MRCGRGEATHLFPRHGHHFPGRELPDQMCFVRLLDPSHIHWFQWTVTIPEPAGPFPQHLTWLNDTCRSDETRCKGASWRSGVVDWLTWQRRQKAEHPGP